LSCEDDYREEKERLEYQVRELQEERDRLNKQKRMLAGETNLAQRQVADLMHRLAASNSAHELAVAAGQEWKRKAEADRKKGIFIAMQNHAFRQALKWIIKEAEDYDEALSKSKEALALTPTQAEKEVAAMEEICSAAKILYEVFGDEAKTRIVVDRIVRGAGALDAVRKERDSG
jgi:hypothetical protein